MTKLLISLLLIFFCTSVSADNMNENYREGRKALSQKLYSQAIPLITKAAEQGHLKAQFNIGNIYLNGEGVTKNYSKAITWFTKAANKGDIDSQTNLGTMYNQGYGVEKSNTKALYWFDKAANAGGAMAQNNLAIIYYENDDKVQAYIWFIIAAASGNLQSSESRAFVETELSEQQIEQAEIRANKLLDKIFSN